MSDIISMKHTPSVEDDTTRPAAKHHLSQENDEIDLLFGCDLVATKIFGYLKPSDLYALTMTSKYFRARVHHEHVVTSAIVEGGHPKQTMQRLVPLIRNKDIYVPSVLRLLRLCLDDKGLCEECDKPKASGAGAVVDSWEFGLSLCDHCLQTRVSNEWFPDYYRDPRVAHSLATMTSPSTYYFKYPYVDRWGESAGPLILTHHMRYETDHLYKEGDAHYEREAHHVKKILLAFDQSMVRNKRPPPERSILPERPTAKKARQVTPATPPRPTVMEEPTLQQKDRRNQQRRLLLLRHASRCPYDAGQCPITPHCTNMKELWKHISHCKDEWCSAQHCVSSRYVLSHFRRCKDEGCDMCGPVRQALRKSSRRELYEVLK